jgi:SAM-dependent methyltransferase
VLDGYDVVVCAGCGLGYADGLPPQSAFDAYYRDLSKYENQHRSGELSDYDRHRFPETANLIAKALPDLNLRILEVGCSTGGLLEALQKEGYKRVVGLDPSPVCTRLAVERCGAKTITGSLSDLGSETGTFDLIILGSVVEHLQDLNGAMAALKACLAPGGHLYIEVPDASRFKDHVHAPFQEFSLEHITYFSPRSLENLLGVHAFEQAFTRQATPEPTPGIFAVEIKALFQHTGTPRPMVRDSITEAALEAYVARSQALEQGLGAILDQLAESRRPILIWGVGTHTQHLLSSSRLAEANIQAFVDSNPNYRGHTLQGAPVLGPGDLASRSEPILISSQQFQEEIADQIRHGLGLPNEIIRLY